MPECDKSSGDCPMKYRIDKLEEVATRNSEQHRNFYNTFESLKISDAVTKENYANIMADLKIMQNKLEQLVSKPGKRYETAITATISAIMAAIITYVVKGG